MKLIPLFLATHLKAIIKSALLLTFLNYKYKLTLMKKSQIIQWETSSVRVMAVIL